MRTSSVLTKEAPMVHANDSTDLQYQLDMLNAGVILAKNNTLEIEESVLNGQRILDQLHQIAVASAKSLRNEILSNIQEIHDQSLSTKWRTKICLKKAKRSLLAAMKSTNHNLKSCSQNLHENCRYVLKDVDKLFWDTNSISTVLSTFEMECNILVTQQDTKLCSREDLQKLRISLSELEAEIIKVQTVRDNCVKLLQNGHIECNKEKILDLKNTFSNISTSNKECLKQTH